MARKRAVILEIDGRVARVLASGGEFRAIRAPRGLGVGDEVDLEDRVSAYGMFPRLALVATLVVFLVFSGAGLNALARSFNEVAAYVTVDINPSIELSVNRWGWVVSARALNAEGGDLLGDTEWRAFKVADLIAELTRRATERGYIAAGKPNAVIVAAAPAAARAQTDAVARELSKLKNQPVVTAGAPEDPPVAITTIMTSDPALRTDAEAMNLSLGKYAVVLEARRSGVPVRVSAVERDGLAKAVEAAGGAFRELILKAEDDHDLGALAAQFAGTLKRERDHDKQTPGSGKKGTDPDGRAGQAGKGPRGGDAPSPGAGVPGAAGASDQQAVPTVTQQGPTGAGGGKDARDRGASQGSAGGSAQPDDRGQAGVAGERSGASGKGELSGESAGRDERGSQGRGKSARSEPDTIGEMIRDGFRELGERIKHQMGKGK